MFDFRRKTLFCLEKRLSKHKMTMFSKNLGGHGPFGPSLVTPMCHSYLFSGSELVLQQVNCASESKFLIKKKVAITWVCTQLTVDTKCLDKTISLPFDGSGSACIMFITGLFLIDDSRHRCQNSKHCFPCFWLDLNAAISPSFTV